MTQSDPVIAAVAEANPVDPGTPRDAIARARADTIRRQTLSAPVRPRRRPQGILVPVLSLLVVLAVVGVITQIGSPPSGAGRASSGRARTIMFQALPTPQTPVVTRPALQDELSIIRERLAPIHGHVHVALVGANFVSVQIGRDVPAEAQARIVPLLTETTQLALYDWEASVLAPNGKTVASELATGNLSALTISQGGSTQAPGAPGAGALPLYQAVLLASRQPAASETPSLSRLGPQYYLFGRADSAACAAVGSAAPGARCLLAGPVDENPGGTRQQAIQDLKRHLPAGVTAAGAGARVVAVPQGVVVLQAAIASPSQQLTVTSPDARFFVLRDQAALTGKDITHPSPSTDPTGAPDVKFQFTPAGAASFQSATARIARRGASVSRSVAYVQHFAIALNNQLLTVPSIDFKQYPDGIIQQGSTGADITGGLTRASARAIATQLRLGTEPLNLRVVG